MRAILILAGLLAGIGTAAADQEVPILDAQMHYSHDAWELVPPGQVIEILKKAGVKRAMVSSSNNEGAKVLQDAAPTVIVPELRPYRSRGGLASWAQDATIVAFLENPRARVLWAHSGFERPEKVRAMLRRYTTLWCDLAFLTAHASNGRAAPGCREAFVEFPDRFVPGPDTFTPERWHYVVEHARWLRQWLAGQPADVARTIAYQNRDRLFGAGQ